MRAPPVPSYRCIHVPGSTVLEVLVALLLTGLVTSGVLSLMVESTRTFAARQRQLDAEAKVRAVGLAVAPALREAGGGLEGARAISLDGERIPVVWISAARARIVVPEGDAREADPEPGGWLRLESVAYLRTGDLMVGLGVGAVEGPSSPLPAGTIRTIVRDRPRGPSGGTVQITWGPAESDRIEAEGPPRALLPVAVREFELRSAWGLELRRRDLGGRWQPIIDGLAAVSFTSPDHPGSSEPPAGAIVQIEARAEADGAPDALARTRVRLR